MHLTLTTNVRISICFHGYVSLLSDYNISNNLLITSNSANQAHLAGDSVEYSDGYCSNYSLTS